MSDNENNIVSLEKRKTLNTILRGVEYLLGASNDLIEDRIEIIYANWPHHITVTREELEEWLPKLVEMGYLTHINVGGKTFLTTKLHEATTAPKAASGAQDLAEQNNQRLFQIGIELDLEQERSVLYRVAFIVESIAFALILREWSLWYFSL